MMGIKREPAQILKENGVAWTHAWLKRLRDRDPDKPKPKFAWPQKSKIALNQHLMPTLLAMTAQHCSYCDGFPMGVMNTNTIDHFKPKETWPDQAFVWENLFACCNACQAAKKARYDDHLLKPDDPTYEFSTYFLFNYRTGNIEVNPFSSKEAQTKAETTLEILDLNNPDLTTHRRRVFETRDPQAPLEALAYRFMFEMI